MRAGITLIMLSGLTVFPVMARPTLDQKTERAVDSLFQAVNRPKTPGCAVEVMRNQQPLLQRVYGLSNLEEGRPLKLDSQFEAGSVSKQFTAAAVALLASQGKLSLEDDVRKFIPELPDYGIPIQLRMLLNHRSGLRDWGDLVELEGWPRGTRAMRQADALRLIARQQALNFVPGTEYLYSNSNFVLAALVVERVSGMGFAEFTRRQLFQPLGLVHTSWRDDFRRLVPGRVQAYAQDDKGTWLLDMPFEDVVGHGGLITTVGDLSRWNAALDAPRPENRDWVTLLQQPGQLTNGTTTAYALGLETAPIQGLPAFSHSGATAGYRSYLARIPSQALSVALLCNAGSLNTEDLGPELTQLFLPKPAAPSPSSPPVLNPAPTGIAGRYRNEKTGVLVNVSVTENTIRFNNGVPFAGVDANTLRSLDGKRQAQIERDATNGIARIQLERIGNAPVSLVPAPLWQPADLTVYVGNYRSLETDGLVKIIQRAGNLIYIDPTQHELPLKPLYSEGFAVGDSGWILRFGREGEGAMSRFSLSRSRSRNVTFSRSSSLSLSS